ncbi:hypothetical protein ACJJTC_017803 [Scirpophaga incertulas]
MLLRGLCNGRTSEPLPAPVKVGSGPRGVTALDHKIGSNPGTPRDTDYVNAILQRRSGSAEGDVSIVTSHCRGRCRGLDKSLLIGRGDAGGETTSHYAFDHRCPRRLPHGVELAWARCHVRHYIDLQK